MNREMLDFKGLLQNDDYVLALGMKHENASKQNFQYIKIKSLAEELLRLIEVELK